MRCRRAPLALLAVLPLLLAADPTPVERQVAVQKAMATARKYLDVNMPAEAVAALEAEVANADGNKAFLTLMREAYLAEMYRLEKVDMPDANKLTQIRRSLALLGGAGAAEKPAEIPTADSLRATPAPLPPPDPLDLAKLPTPDQFVFPPDPNAAAEACAAFKQGKYAEAAELFAGAEKLTPQQKAAWAYCRIKVAADRLNAPGCDAATADAVAADVTEALKLVPQHTELQKVGQAVIANAKAKGASSLASPGREPGEPANVIETASFRVRHAGNRELAEAVAKAAEEQRKAIFERWSGPPAGAWSPKCEITIHPTAEAYAKATGRPPGSTGNAAVRLTDGHATERGIHLRADDAGITANALPRELTHVILADLFPAKAPPKWAEEGMAILAGSPEEVGRYTRTLPRCAREGDWLGLAQLMDLKEFPADKITGFYCESVSLTEYLIRAAGGERNFTIFLRDCQRYGTAAAVKRQYGVDGPQALEGAWKRAALETGRAQAP
jgi:hypothetical protein